MVKRIKNIKLNTTVLGIVLMLLHAFAMASAHTFGAKLTKVMNPDQVAFIYRFSVLFAILPWCSQGGFINNLRTKRIVLHFARGVFSGLGSICFYHAVRIINVSDASAISYLEQVLVLCVGFFYFKEKVTLGKVIMIICGIIGTVMIIKPGFREFDGHYVFLFMAICFWAMNNISIKVLGKTERSKTQVFYATLFSSLLALPLAMSHTWPTFHWSFIKYIIILGFFHFLHSIAFFKALKIADLTVLMPFDYTRIIFTSILGYMVLGSEPDMFSLLGYILIILGGTYLIIEEGKRKKMHEEIKAEFKSDVKDS